MKKNRRETILRMIENETISTQDEIIKRLRSEGFDVTQATVSRDIKNLGLVKATDSHGVYRYIAVKNDGSAPDNKFISVFSSSVLEIIPAGNIVAVKCVSGMASAAAAVLDSMESEHVVASLAGDDTIFVLCKDEEAAVAFSVFTKKFI